MISISARTARLLAIAALCAATSLSPAQPPPSAFQSLAGPGESMSLKAKSIEMITGKDGAVIRSDWEGNVILRSPKLNLDADSMSFKGEDRILSAKGNVKIDRPDVKATADQFFYDFEKEEIRMIGNPRVEQIAEGSSALFEGMDEITIKTLPTGGNEIRMKGGSEEINAEFKTPEKAATPDAKQGSNAAPAKASGFAGLGNNVRIRTRPKGSTPPALLLTTANGGGFGQFRAVGSVLLKSEDMDLRADELEYDSKKELVEALHNVYIKQDQIESDCGRMLYDLAKDVITLSVNPTVRQQQADGVMSIKRMDSFVITRLPDGNTKTDARGGSAGDPEYSWEAKPLPAVATPKPLTEPTEIRIGSDEDIKKISR